MLASFNVWLESSYSPIAGGALESDIIGVWWSKQTAKGSPATMTTVTGKKGRMVGGDLQVNRTDGTEAFSDTSLFGDQVDFINTLIGNGAPVIQGQSGVIGHLFWLACGQETVTGGVNAVHTLTSTATGGNFGYQFTAAGKTYTTAVQPSTVTAAAFQTAMLAATAPDGSTPPAGSIVTAGGPLNTTPITVTFQGAFAAQPVAVGTLVNSTLTGGTLTPTVSTPGTMYQHTATPSDSGGFYSTWVRSVGKTTNVRQQFNDCRITQVRLEGSSASKVVKITPTFISLDPGQILTTDPTQTEDGTRPFIYTEASGAFIIDGVVYRGQTAFAVVFTWGLAETYGDDVTPYDLTNTNASVTLEGITIVLDALSLQRYYVQYYGVAAPAANAKPIKTLPAVGSYRATFNRGYESLDILIPGVKWDPNALNIPANPTGGPVEFPLAGSMRKVAGLPAFTITTSNFRDPAFTI